MLVLEVDGMNNAATGSADSHVIRYRPDVDGLRAIAVLAVIFYHLYSPAVARGFLGVDMFFVLSGFLITSIIWREAQRGEFSVRRFYERRVRRIVPALLVVLAVTSVAASLVLLPADLIGYCKSVIATLSFSANIYFWQDTDYFSRAAEYKPLLHMWSLGVEEQFYIFFPLLLAFLVRFRTRIAFLTTIAIAIFSFAANAFLNYADGVQPAFFLLPTRAWELGAGAAIALLPAAFVPKRSAGLLSAAGIVLVAAGIFLSIPLGIIPAGAPVVAGTSLLIFAGRNRQLPAVNRLLTLRPVVFIGLISYSLYLWHWPVFVLLRYYFVDGVPVPVWIVSLAFIAAVSAASWHFVERPFRNKRLPIRRVVFVTASSAAALACAALVILHDGGLPQRFSVQAATINAAVGNTWHCRVSQDVPLGMLHVCPLNLPSRNAADAQAVLFGNSHAAMYAPAWQSIFAEHRVNGFLVSLKNGCMPTVRWNRNTACFPEARRYVGAVLRLRNVRTVIVALTWWNPTLVTSDGRVVDNRDNSVLMSAIDDLDARFERAGKRVILVGPVMWPRWDVPTEVGRDLAYGVPIKRPLYTSEAFFMGQFGGALRHFRTQKAIVFVPAYEAQCRQGRCYYVLQGHSLYADDNHLAAGEIWRFRPMFETAYTAVATVGKPIVASRRQKRAWIGRPADP